MWIPAILVSIDLRSMLLKFSAGNAKLHPDTLIFNLPAGRTCPGADKCRAWAVVNNGKRNLVRGDNTEFTCFAARAEAQYPSVYDARKNNFDLINASDNIEELIYQSIQSALKKRRRKYTRIRIHESGDFFNIEYLNAWIEVAKRMPDLKFYCYSKSLHLFCGVNLPENFYLTASYGGKYDALIDAGKFPRYAKVVQDIAEAAELNLPLDGVKYRHEERCFMNGPFALLLHGMQSKESNLNGKVKVNAAFLKPYKQQHAGV